MQIANLLVWREMTGKAHEVERLYNAVRAVYATRNLSMPDSPLAREVIKGSRRIHAEEKKDIDRVEFPIAEFRKYCVLNEGRLRTRTRDRCLLALGLRCMRRPSELAAFKRRHLSWVAPSLANWVAPDNTPQGFENRWLRVYVRSQKNDQEANGQFILIEPTWSRSCPCRLLVDYLQEFNFQIGESAQGHAPLFVSLNDNASPISSGAVNSAVKRVAKVLGLGPNVTGHSLRIGGCTAAAAAGIPMEIIRVIGGWFSDAMLGYIRAAAAPALLVTHRMGL
jgi:integrase